jgi:hypothetical protein
MLQFEFCDKINGDKIFHILSTLRLHFTYFTAFYGILWHFTVFYGILRHFMAFYGILRHFTAFYSILRHIMTLHTFYKLY